MGHRTAAGGIETGTVGAKVYKKLDARVMEVRRRLGRPLTLTEKVLASHLTAWPKGAFERGSAILRLCPDHIALQDGMAQRILPGGTASVPSGRSPTISVHCDHRLRVDTEKDGDEEALRLLQSSCAACRADLFAPGTGVLHHVILERIAYPGSLLFVSDSHAAHAGGLAALAFAVQRETLAHALEHEPMSLVNPKLIGVRLFGTLNGLTSAYDVALKLAGRIALGGATSAILEYFGPGADTLSCAAKCTITNIGAELGSLSSIFPFDANMERFLEGSGRGKTAESARVWESCLRADHEVESRPEEFFDEVIDFDLTCLTPQWAGPLSLDLVRSVEQMKSVIAREGYEDRVTRAVIAGCCGTAYEDLTRAGTLAARAAAAGIKAKAPLVITPGSGSIAHALERDNFLEAFAAIGAIIAPNGCGSCIDERAASIEGKSGTCVTTLHRVIGQPEAGGLSRFVGSPTLVMGAALSGSLSFDPRIDCISGPNGDKFQFES